MLCKFYCLFIQFMRFSQQAYWGSLPFPPPVDHVLSELSALSHLSWVSLHSVAHSFIELCKPLCHHTAVIHEGRDKSRQCAEKQRHYCAGKGLYSQGYSLELDCKKEECWRIDDFELWCWRRLLRVPWTERRPNQSILREINPEYWLQGLMLKVKLQYFGYLMRTADSLEKSLMLGKIEVRREKGIRGWNGWVASPMQWMWTWANFRRWWGIGRPGMLQSMGSQRVREDWAIEQVAIDVYTYLDWTWDWVPKLF